MAPSSIEAKLRRRFRALPRHGELLTFDSIDSTHRRARKGEDLPHLSLVLADAQTEGVGREGRTWCSPRDKGLYATVVLREEGVPASRLGWFNLLLARETLESLRPCLPGAGANLSLKWPNDVLDRGRKLAGVLVDAVNQDGQLRRVVASVGVNLDHQRHDFPAGLRDTATSVALGGGRVPCRADLAMELVERIDGLWRSLPSLDPEEARRRWSEAAPAIPGGRLRVLRGEEVLEGEALGLSLEGHLRLRTSRGEERIASGRVARESPSPASRTGRIRSLQEELP